MLHFPASFSLVPIPNGAKKATEPSWPAYEKPHTPKRCWWQRVRRLVHGARPGVVRLTGSGRSMWSKRSTRSATPNSSPTTFLDYIVDGCDVRGNSWYNFLSSCKWSGTCLWEFPSQEQIDLDGFSPLSKRPTTSPALVMDTWIFPRVAPSIDETFGSELAASSALSPRRRSRRHRSDYTGTTFFHSAWRWPPLPSSHPRALSTLYHSRKRDHRSGTSISWRQHRTIHRVFSFFLFFLPPLFQHSKKRERGKKNSQLSSNQFPKEKWEKKEE